MAESVDAKARLGPEDALRLAALAETIYAAKGKNVVAIARKDRPDRAALLSHLLGPTGTLRAPTIRAGRTLYVGFDEATYRKLLD